jgi:GSCFA family
MTMNPKIPTLNFFAGNAVNQDWYVSRRGMDLTARRTPILKPTSKVFTIGSCFAHEVRKALKLAGVEVYPKWNDLEIDFSSQIVAKLHGDDNINHYDSFVVLQEFRDALLQTELGETDFLQLKGTPAGQRLGVGTVWQDPYRKQVYGSSFGALSNISNKFSACIREGLEKADVYVITLGLIEVWRNPVNGRYFCRPPGTGFNGGQGRDKGEFYLSTYEDNLANVRQIIDLLHNTYPDKHIILSVSPVGLERTFSDDDVIVANTYSKAVLRAVVGQVMNEYAKIGTVHYMPAFEVSQRIDIFDLDGRHVTENAAQFIVDIFKLAFFDAPPAKQA